MNTSHLFEGIVTVLMAIIGVAIIAVLVSQQANTSGVISSAASGFAEDLSAATAPVTGAGGGGGFSGFTGLGSPIGSVNY
jgi:hypothetical protein